MIASSTQRLLFAKTYSKMGIVDHEINKQAETRKIGRWIVAKNRKKEQVSRRLVLDYSRVSHFLIYRFFPFSPILPPHFLLFSPTHAVFNTPHHLFRRFCPLSRRTINFPDLNPDHDRHRPLPLPQWLCTTRKCGLYKLRAPLFTGLTTYLRELDPLDSISIFGSILSVAPDALYLAFFPGRDLSDTFACCFYATHPSSLFWSFYLSCRFIRVSHADVASE